jgi:PAS domain S-box-containing protein
MKRVSKKVSSHSLMCWDIVMQQRAMHDVARKHFNLFDFQQQYHWAIDLNELLNTDFDAIVLTDTKQKVLWVSEGFKKMTGYAPVDAIGRTPAFLQGEATSLEIRQRIREQLSVPRPVTERLVNYKKNGLQYTCQVQIRPLFTIHGELAHFIALEKELRNYL